MHQEQWVQSQGSGARSSQPTQEEVTSIFVQASGGYNKGRAYGFGPKQYKKPSRVELVTYCTDTRMMEEISNSSPKKYSEAETDEATKFNKSLQELKDLCSQLHHAADYCEKRFQKAEEKKDVVENTKEYLCRAVVTVVDHLGCVSAKLECRISKIDTAAETELRIDGLTQRFATCQQYSHKLALTRFCWTTDLTTYNRRYISPPTQDLRRMKEMSSVPIDNKATDKGEFEAEEDVPLFLYTYSCKPSLLEDSEQKPSFSPTVLPVRDGLSVVPKSQNFNFEFQEARKLKRNILNWRPMHNKDIKSLIRRGRRIVA